MPNRACAIRLTVYRGPTHPPPRMIRIASPHAQIRGCTHSRKQEGERPPPHLHAGDWWVLTLAMRACRKHSRADTHFRGVPETELGGLLRLLARRVV